MFSLPHSFRILPVTSPRARLPRRDARQMPFPLSPLCVLASLALTWVYVCVSVCVSQACPGNGPCVHRLRAVDTVPPCDCETRRGARGEGGRERGPFPTHGCRATSAWTRTQLCPFRGQNLIFLLVQSSEPSLESLRISLSMKVPTKDGVSKQQRGPGRG